MTLKMQKMKEDWNKVKNKLRNNLVIPANEIAQQTGGSMRKTIVKLMNELNVETQVQDVFKISSKRCVVQCNNREKKLYIYKKKALKGGASQSGALKTKSNAYKLKAVQTCVSQTQTSHLKIYMTTNAIRLNMCKKKCDNIRRLCCQIFFYRILWHFKHI